MTKIVICPLCKQRTQADMDAAANICEICKKPFVTAQAEEVPQMEISDTQRTSEADRLFNIICAILEGKTSAGNDVLEYNVKKFKFDYPLDERMTEVDRLLDIKKCEDNYCDALKDYRKRLKEYNSAITDEARVENLLNCLYDLKKKDEKKHEKYYFELLEFINSTIDPSKKICGGMLKLKLLCVSLDELDDMVKKRKEYVKDKKNYANRMAEYKKAEASYDQKMRRYNEDCEWAFKNAEPLPKAPKPFTMIKPVAWFDETSEIWFTSFSDNVSATVKSYYGSQDIDDNYIELLYDKVKDYSGEREIGEFIKSMTPLFSQKLKDIVEAERIRKEKQKKINSAKKLWNEYATYLQDKKYKKAYELLLGKQNVLYIDDELKKFKKGFFGMKYLGNRFKFSVNEAVDKTVEAFGLKS